MFKTTIKHQLKHKMYHIAHSHMIKDQDHQDAFLPNKRMNTIMKRNVRVTSTNMIQIHHEQVLVCCSRRSLSTLSFFVFESANFMLVSKVWKLKNISVIIHSLLIYLQFTNKKLVLLQLLYNCFFSVGANFGVLISIYGTCRYVYFLPFLINCYINNINHFFNT